MKRVTRERARVDRIACPWLITRFIDPEPQFLFVPAAKVLEPWGSMRSSNDSSSRIQRC